MSSTQQATERTALSGDSARYDNNDGASSGAASETTGLGLRSNRRSLSDLALAVVVISAIFLTGVLLSSAVHLSSKRDSSGVGSRSASEGSLVEDPASSSDDRATSEGAAKAHETTIIPAMQPFSTVDPADAFCPHMDRPEVKQWDVLRLLLRTGLSALTSLSLCLVCLIDRARICS